MTTATLVLPRPADASAPARTDRRVPALAVPVDAHPVIGLRGPADTGTTLARSLRLITA